MHQVYTRISHSMCTNPKSLPYSCQVVAYSCRKLPKINRLMLPLSRDSFVTTVKSERSYVDARTNRRDRKVIFLVTPAGDSLVWNCHRVLCLQLVWALWWHFRHRLQFPAVLCFTSWWTANNFSKSGGNSTKKWRHKHRIIYSGNRNETSALQ